MLRSENERRWRFPLRMTNTPYQWAFNYVQPNGLERWLSISECELNNHQRLMTIVDYFTASLGFNNWSFLNSRRKFFNSSRSSRVAALAAGRVLMMCGVRSTINSSSVVL